MDRTRANGADAASSERDSEVRACLARGDATRATELVLERYGEEIFGFLLASVADAHVASDIYSDFSVDVWKGIAGFEWRSSFRTWLYRVAKRAQYRYLRRRSSRREERLATDAQSGIPQVDRSRTLGFLPTALRDGFSRLREHLTPEDHELLLLRIDRRLPFSEIAAVLAADDASDAELDRLASTLRMRFSRLKERLRELAAREGLIDRDRG